MGGAEKGHASAAMGLRAVGSPVRAGTPSRAGLASPGPRLPPSPSSLLLPPVLICSQIRTDSAPLPAECSRLVPGQLKHRSSKTQPPLVMSCPSSRVSLASALPCALTQALQASHRIARGPSSGLFQAPCLCTSHTLHLEGNPSPVHGVTLLLPEAFPVPAGEPSLHRASRALAPVSVRAETPQL